MKSTLGKLPKTREAWHEILVQGKLVFNFIWLQDNLLRCSQGGSVPQQVGSQAGKVCEQGGAPACLLLASWHWQPIAKPGKPTLIICGKMYYMLSLDRGFFFVNRKSGQKQTLVFFLTNNRILKTGNDNQLPKQGGQLQSNFKPGWQFTA